MRQNGTEIAGDKPMTPYIRYTTNGITAPYRRRGLKSSTKLAIVTIAIWISIAVIALAGG